MRRCPFVTAVTACLCACTRVWVMSHMQNAGGDPCTFSVYTPSSSVLHLWQIIDRICHQSSMERKGALSISPIITGPAVASSADLLLQSPIFSHPGVHRLLLLKNLLMVSQLRNARDIFLWQQWVSRANKSFIYKVTFSIKLLLDYDLQLMIIRSNRFKQTWGYLQGRAGLFPPNPACL